MARTCSTCGGKRHDPSCPEMFWPDGTRRGEHPGPPPAKSMTWQDEVSDIFSGVVESMIERHIAAQRERDR